MHGFSFRDISGCISWDGMHGSSLGGISGTIYGGVGMTCPKSKTTHSSSGHRSSIISSKNGASVLASVVPSDTYGRVANVK